jgi:hypothetical protein
MKNSILSIVIALSTLLSSCGGSKKHPEIASLKPESTSVGGDLAEYLQIVENDYEINGHYIGKLSVKIKALKAYPRDKDFDLNGSLLTEGGSPISGISQFSLNLDSKNKLKDLLKRGTGEEVLSFDAYGYSQEMNEKAKKFSLTGVVKEPYVASESPATSDLAVSTTADSDNNFDELLDAYEKHTDDYVDLINDMSSDNVPGAMGDYASLYQSSVELGQKLGNAKGELSTGQLSRMMTIQAKLAQAMEKANRKMK